MFGLEDFYRNFKGISFLCFANVIDRLERRKAASRSRGKNRVPSQNTGKKASTLSRGFAKFEVSGEKRSILLAIKTHDDRCCYCSEDEKKDNNSS